MTNTVKILTGLLVFFCGVLGVIFGHFDIIGLVESGMYSFLILFLAAVTISYIVAILVFVLDFAHLDHIKILYWGCAGVFGFFSYLSNGSIITSLLIAICFAAFLHHIESQGVERATLFVKFKTREIFVPVVRQAFAFLILIFAVSGFMRTTTLMDNRSVTPDFVILAGTPFIKIFSDQLGGQMQRQLGAEFYASVDENDRVEIVRFVLAEMVESMSEGQPPRFFGFDPESIPLEKTLVYRNGEIDLTPVMVAMAPQIAEMINRDYAPFVIFIPAIVALLIVLFLQPLFFPFHLIAGFVLVPLIFNILRSTKVLTVHREKREVEVVQLG